MSTIMNTYSSLNTNNTEAEHVIIKSIVKYQRVINSARKIVLRYGFIYYFSAKVQTPVRLLWSTIYLVHCSKIDQPFSFRTKEPCLGKCLLNPLANLIALHNTMIFVNCKVNKHLYQQVYKDFNSYQISREPLLIIPMKK